MLVMEQKKNNVFHEKNFWSIILDGMTHILYITVIYNFTKFHCVWGEATNTSSWLVWLIYIIVGVCEMCTVHKLVDPLFENFQPTDAPHHCNPL